MGAVVVEAGATLTWTTVRGPAVIGAGGHLTDTFVGPFTSIADGCTVESSQLETART